MSEIFTNAKIVGVNYDSKVYHATQSVKRGNPSFVMSRSELCDFAVNPDKWLKGKRLNDDGDEEETADSKSTKFGSLVDTILLDSGRFAQKIAVSPENYTNKKGEMKLWSNNSTEGKEWKADNASKLRVSHGMLLDANIAVRNILQDPWLGPLVECSQPSVLITAEYYDKATKLTIPLKFLLDMVPDKAHLEYGKSLADLKSSKSAIHRKWARSVNDFDYDVQGWMYREAYVSATGEERSDFRHVIVENTWPFAVGRRLLSHEYMQKAQHKTLEALWFYCQCVKEQSFPGYDDVNSFRGWTTVDPEPYMIKQ